MKIKSIREFDKIENKKVLVRVDFNVPISGGEILDEYKIVQQIPTIRYLLKRKCRIILMTHLGRPKPGKIDDNFSTEVLAPKLAQLLKVKVRHLKSFNFFRIGTEVSKLQGGDILLLENLRFNKEEEENSKVFARHLARLADVYVNEAFAVSHRAHASVDAIKKYIPAYAGLLLENEIEHLGKILKPKKPLVVVIGGVKMKTKMPLIKKLHKNAFRVLVGGALANNFFAAHKLEIGRSLCDAKSIKFAKSVKDKNIILPIDVVVSSKKDGGRTMVKDVNKVDKKDYIFDIGPKTIQLYSSFIKRAETIIWNGPMGFFEMKEFRHGTLSVARVVASRSKGKAFGVAGGGETVEALKLTHMFDYVDWVSTGGGAMLEFLGGNKMPGLKKIVKDK